MTSTAMLIVNPSSGKEKGKKYLKLAEDTLLKRFDRVDIRLTEKAGDATTFAKDSAMKGYDACIAMGGDGTLNETINGLAEQKHRPTFGLVPLGTVNDLARALKISKKPKQAIKMLATAKETPLDIGRINSHYFMNVVAIGSIPEAVDRVSVKQKTQLGAMAYFIEGAKAYARKEKFNFEVKTTDEVHNVESELIIVSLTNSVGGFEKLAPEAEVNDGLFHVFIVTDSSVIERTKLLPQLFSGQVSQNGGLIAFKSNKVFISSKESILKSNVDGDPDDYLPLELEVLPSHLNVFTPVDA